MIVVRRESIDSTNLEVKRLWSEMEMNRGPLAVRADEQTAGIGREGRAWHSPHGGIWLSVCWPIAKPASVYTALPLVVGLSVSEALSARAGVATTIKWPNDLLCGDRKIAGILCQGDTSLEPAAIVIGVGVNVNFDPAILGGDLRQPATSVFAETGAETDLMELESEILTILSIKLSRFERDGFAPFQEKLNAQLAWVGRRVSCESGSSAKSTEGEIVRVESDGALLLSDNGKEFKVISGETTRLRPHN